MSNGDESGLYSEAAKSHWMWFKEKVMLPFASSVTLDVSWTWTRVAIVVILFCCSSCIVGFLLVCFVVF